MDRFLQNNTILRIVAVILSCILWLTVTLAGAATSPSPAGTVVRQSSFQVQVETNPDLVATVVSNPTVVVAATVDVLNASALPAQMLGVAVVADARGLGPGRHTVALAAVNMPASLKGNFTIEPGTISILLEQKTQSQRNVKITVDGKPAVGYMSGTPSTDTPVVQVRGSQTNVAQVSAVLAPVSIQGLAESVTRSVSLTPVDATGKLVAGVELTPSSVNVTVPIEAPQMTATLVPEIVGTPAPGYAVSGVTVNPTVVSVFGLPTALPQSQTLAVPVNVNGMRNSTTLQSHLPLPTGVTKVDPLSVTVTLTLETSVSKFFTGVPIAIQNAPSQRQVKLSGPTLVDVTVSGPKSVVDGLTASSIQVYVDAGSLKPGDNSAPLNVLLPTWVQVNQLSLDKVSVAVK